MPREAENYFLSLLRRSRRPKILFHYTSPRGLLGIAQSGHIWATAVEYLNDGLEWQLADYMMRDRLSELIEKGDNPQRVACFKSIRRAHDLFSERRMYVASFSERGDLLSQWRAYCPPSGGFAVGIPFGTLAKTPHTFLVPCVYSPDVHKEHCSKILEFLADHHGEYNTPALHREFLWARRLFAAAVKHESFREEREWRLVTWARSDSAVCFREGRSGLVPYIKLPLASADSPLRLSKVVVGPNPHEFLAFDAARQLLGPGVEVKTAETPYRSW